MFVAAGERDEVDRLILGRAPGRHEHHWLGREETELVVEWCAIPISDVDGEPRLLITGLDVSERSRQASPSSWVST